MLQEFESKLKRFNDVELSPLQKQANTLMRDCDEADKAKLQALIQGQFIGPRIVIQMDAVLILCCFYCLKNIYLTA